MTAYRIQIQILAALFLVFVVFTVGMARTLVPAAAAVGLVGSAIVIARVTRARLSFAEPAAVWALGSMLLFLSGRCYMGFETWASLSTVGSFCILGAWALGREPLAKPRLMAPGSTFTRVLRGTWTGLGVAAIVVLCLTVFREVVLALGEPIPVVQTFGAWSVLMLAYLTGGASAGALAGVLRPLTRWPLGTMFFGFLALGIVVLFIAVAQDWIRDPQGSPRILYALGAAASLGGIGGPVFGLMIRAGIGRTATIDGKSESAVTRPLTRR